MSLLQIEPVPQTLLDAIARVARERFGAGDLEGPALARAIQKVSAAYTRVEGSPAQVAGDREALCARLKFFLARDFPKLQAPLAELASVSAFPAARELRVLDLGAGLGTSGLGAAAFAFARGAERVRIEAVDRDAQALDLAGKLAAYWAAAEGWSLAYSARRAPLGREGLTGLAGAYDLIVIGFVLNELSEETGPGGDADARHHALLQRLAGHLSADGALVVLEPALRETSRSLQRVRTRFAAEPGPPHVFAPCLHRDACPLLERERDWCHEQLPLALPEPLQVLARSAGLRTTELSYSYLTLTRAERSLAELDPERRGYRVVSGALRSKGKLELLVCGSGPLRRLQRLDRAKSDDNAALDNARRGTIVHLPTPETEPAPLARVGAQTRIAPLQQIAEEPRTQRAHYDKSSRG